MGLSNDLTLMLGIECVQNVTEEVDNINSRLSSFIGKVTDAGEAGSSAGARLDAAFNDPVIAAARLDAQTNALAESELRLAGASDALMSAQADMAAGVEGAAAAQSAALKEFDDAQAAVITRSGEVDASLDAQNAKMRESAGAADESAVSGGKFSKVMGGVGIASIAVAGAVGLIAEKSVKAASAYQSSTANIAASGQMSIDSATKIGAAFLTTAGDVTMSAQDIDSAYGSVVGQLQAVEHHTLSSGQALSFMKTQIDLSEASGESLNTVTATTVKMMQAYTLPLKDAASASNNLYVASRMTGTSVSQVGGQIAKLKSRLGDLAPTIQDTSATMIDFAQHGETGRIGMTLLSSAMNTLLKTGTQTTPTMQEVATAMKALPASLQPLAQQLDNGTISTTAFAKATANLSPALKNEITAFQGLVTKSQETASTMNAMKTTPAQDELSALGIQIQNASGKFIGMKSLITQLQPKLEAMSPAQAKIAATALFGASSEHKMIGTIMAGPAAYDAAQKAVSAHDAVVKAAAKNTATMKADEEKLHSSLHDVSIELGTALIPMLTNLMKTVLSVAKPIMDFITTHKKLSATILEVVAATAVLVAGLYIVAKVVSTVRSAFGGASSAQKAMTQALEQVNAANVQAATDAEAASAAIDTEGASADTTAASLDTMGASAAAAGGEAEGAGAAMGAGGLGKDAAVGEGAMSDLGTAAEGAGGEIGGASSALGPFAIAVAAGTIGALALGSAISKWTGANAVTGPLNSIIKSLNNLPGGTQNVLQMQVRMDALTKSIDRAGGSTADNVAKLKSLASDGMGAASTAAQKLVNEYESLHQAIPQTTTNLDVLSKTFGISQSNAQSLASELNLNLTKSLDPADIKAFSSELVNSGMPVNQVTALVKGLATTTEASTAAMETSVSTHVPNMVTKTQAGVNNMLNFFNTAAFGPAGAAAIDRAAQGVSNNKSLSTNTKQSVDDAYTAASGETAQFAAIGQQITSAMSSGIAQYGSNVVGQFQGLINEVNAVAAGAHGPSAPLPPPKAAGGPVLAGTTYLVGEEGPELFAPGYSGAIIPINFNSGGQSGAGSPAAPGPAPMAGPASQTIQVFAETNADPYQISREVAWVLKTAGS